MGCGTAGQVRLEWSGTGSVRSYPRYQRRLSRSPTVRISWRSERNPSKKRINCNLKKTTGSKAARGRRRPRAPSRERNPDQASVPGRRETWSGGTKSSSDTGGNGPNARSLIPIMTGRSLRVTPQPRERHAGPGPLPFSTGWVLCETVPTPAPDRASGRGRRRGEASVVPPAAGRPAATPASGSPRAAASSRANRR